MISYVNKKILSLTTHILYFCFCRVISTMLLFYLVVILFNVIQIDGSLAACRQTFGSNEYDLNQLDHLTLLGDDGAFRYALTPCALISTAKCGTSTQPFEKGMTACQERISSTTFESSMGFLDGYGKTPNIEFSENPQGPGTGVVMIMRNAKCNGAERRVTTTFICDQSVHNPTKMDVSEAPSCNFTIIVRAAEACPIGGGLGGGTVFIIILLVVIVVYLLGGILYNRFKLQQTGLAVLPHPNFWLLMLGSFVTGCRYTLSIFRNCGGGSSKSAAAYQSV